MRRFLWIAIGLCLSNSLAQGAQPEEWTKSFNITGRAELRVDTSDAQIHVETWDEKKIEAHITPANGVSDKAASRSMTIRPAIPSNSKCASPTAFPS